MAADIRLGRLCDELIRRWREDGPAPVERFLAAHPEIEPGGEDEFELIFAEYLLAEDFGLAPAPAEYLDRFPRQADRLRRQLTLHQLLDEGGSLGGADGSTLGDERAATPPASRDRRWPMPEGYQVERLLGRGGMGVVYQARQVRLNRVVALKMIRSGVHASPEDSSRFRAEAEVIAQFQHPHIVRIHAMGDYDGQPFFEMEYVDGGSLADRLDGTPRPAREAAALLEVIARTMHDAHGRGIVHRDLKPANILLTAGGSPKIADFGLAKLLDADSGLTRSDSALGSPGYMAPEQAGGARRAIGPAADIYAMGVIFYELMTGRRPFAAPSVMETLDLVRNAEPVPPSKLRPGLPRDAETIALRCLAKEPARRYPSASALADDLACFLAGRPILARPVGLAERAWRWARRNRALAGLIAAVAGSLVLGFAGMAVLWSRAVREARNAQIQADLTDRARRAEQVSRAEVDRISAGLSLDRGLALAEGGKVDRGLHDMAEALRLDPEDRAGLGRAVRRNLTAWAGEVPRLLAAAEMPDGARPGQFSPDGRYYAAPNRSGSIRIWDLATLRPVDSLGAHAGPASRVAFRPDGEALASSGEDGTVRLWDSATGRPAGPPLAHTSEVYRIAWRADGRRLAAVSGTRLWVWDSDRPGRPSGPIDCGGWVDQVLFAPNKPWVVTANLSGEVQRWDPATRSRVGPPIVVGEWIRDVAFSPDGSRLVVGVGRFRRELDPSSNRGGARLYDAETWRPMGPLLDHNAAVGSVDFRADGRGFLTGDAMGTTRQWDRDGRPLGAPIKGEVGYARPVLSPDGQYLLLGSSTGRARLWDLHRARPLGALLERAGEVLAAFRPDGRSIAVADDRQVALYAAPLEGQPPPMLHRTVIDFAFRDDRSLFTCGRDGSARLWDIASARPLAAAMNHEDFVECIDFLPGGALVATGGRDQTVRLWDGEGQPIGPPTRAPHYVFALKLVDGGRRLVVGSADNTARLLDLADRKWVGSPIQHREVTPGNVVNSIAVTPDGTTALSVSNDGTVARMDLRSGRQVGRLIEHPAQTSDVDVNWQGTRLLILSAGVVHVIDAANGEPLRRIGQSLSSVDFLPDGRTILTGGGDRLARRWDAETGRPVGAPFDAGKPVAGVSASPDGQLGLIVTIDGQARFWDLESGEPVGPARPCLTAGFNHQPKFAPGGRSVAIFSNWVEVWDVPAPRQGTYDQIRAANLTTDRDDAGDRLGWDSTGPGDPGPGPSAARDEGQQAREAVACLLRNNPAGALWHLDRIADVGPEAWLRHARRAQAALLLGRGEMVAAELAEARRLATPEQALAWDANFAGDASRAGRWDIAIAALDRYLARRPDDLIMSAERGWARARVGDWAGARADIERAYRDRSPDLNHLFRRALLERMAGDFAGYRAVCDLFMARRKSLASPPESDVERFINWLFALCPDALADYDLPLRWLGPDAHSAVGGPGRHGELVYGALLYRAGRPEQAIPFLDRTDREARPDDAARSWPFLAMSHARLGRAEEGRRWLDRLRAECAKARRDPDRFWDDLDLQILLEEAEAVVLDAAWPANPFAPRVGP